jgi:hypothetical protein
MLGGSIFTTAWLVLKLRMEVLRIRMVAANSLNKQSRTADKDGPPAWGLGVGPTPLTVNISYCYEMFHSTSHLD